MDKERKNWTLSIGFYPGICFGVRTYEEPDQTTYVLYIPFVDISLEIHDNYWDYLITEYRINLLSILSTTQKVG